MRDIAAIRYEYLTEKHIDAIVEMWNRELGSRFPLSDRLVRQNSFGAAPLQPGASWAAIAAQDGGEILIGFVAGKLSKADGDGEGGGGSIGLLLVDAAYRRQGIGSRLLALAEDGLRRSGAGRIDFGGETRHYMPGLPEESEASGLGGWLERRGYTPAEGGSVCDLFADFTGEPIEELPQCPGVEFRLLDPLAETEAFLCFLRREFSPRWAQSTEALLQAGGGSREFVLLWKDGGVEPIGFCRLNDEQSPLLAGSVYWHALFPPGTGGGIGPLGVSASERGQGLGLAAVQAGIHFLRRRGRDRLVIDWTTHLDFYAKLGFAPWRWYTGYRKGDDAKTAILLQF
ncbi:GNAT family N-acetyltransferase [Paenibacillus koleovorans]|uniref:GNAT family N-acetyltransferase n=1 Tax=Paenibacillus koleovorans TaxID=121608 RepID=UPI000FDC3BA1|nr:GNAT family N-acetyltransferase [Paenibacillus koleovorans]